MSFMDFSYRLLSSMLTCINMFVPVKSENLTITAVILYPDGFQSSSISLVFIVTSSFLVCSVFHLPFCRSYTMVLSCGAGHTQGGTGRMTSAGQQSGLQRATRQGPRSSRTRMAGPDPVARRKLGLKIRIVYFQVC
jgi:hypothetical protein